MYRTHALTCLKRWESNLYDTQQPEFVDRMISEIKSKRKLNAIRIHPEGDFYNQEYLNKWATIAKRLPHVQFYAYTKALHLDFSEIPNNLKIIQSFGGEHDHLINLNKPHAFIFDTEADLIQDRYLDCSDDDLIAADPNTIKIGLISH
jgi:hypothetical protein